LRFLCANSSASFNFILVLSLLTPWQHAIYSNFYRSWLLCRTLSVFLYELYITKKKRKKIPVYSKIDIIIDHNDIQSLVYSITI
jgi:hypothetical protein